MPHPDLQPDSTAVRVALWRALHIEADPPPHVLRDDVGLALVAPGATWRERPDMEPGATARVRASIVARGRFVEDLVTEEAGRGVEQYVILGAGLDSFAQRRADLAVRLRLFELDQPETQAWKRRRLADLGYETPESLRFVPVDFEADWWGRLSEACFDADKPAVVVSAGVVMYLSRVAVAETLGRLSSLASGSRVVISFLQPLTRVEAEERSLREATEHFARAAGTPFRSFFTPEDLQELALYAGFKAVEHLSARDLTERYFAGRADGLRPSSSEALLVAST